MKNLIVVTLSGMLVACAGGQTLPASYTSAALDLEEDKAVIQTTTEDHLNLLFGKSPDVNVARESANQEATRVCALHGRIPVPISESCQDWEENIGMFQKGCRTHRFLFACQDTGG